MIVRLPFPDPALSPNRAKGRAWQALLAKKLAARDAGFYATKQAATEFEAPSGDIALSLLFLTPDKRRRDADNLLAASKSMLDGMADALGVDDRRFRPILVDWQPGPPGGALLVAVGVEIRSGVNL